MTTTRPELILEGSDDQVNWREYSFRYKPGELHRGLPQIAPYQPRLDWQMWFAALEDIQENRWVDNLLYRLMTGEPSVIGLLDPPPFQTPPHYMRVLIYEYTFTTPAERERTGAVWQRKLLGPWFGPVSLTGK
jgi:lipase maturation factor 1